MTMDKQLSIPGFPKESLTSQTRIFLGNNNYEKTIDF
jgi:hypothetical protein